MQIIPNSFVRRNRNNFFSDSQDNQVDKLHNTIDILLKEKNIDIITSSMILQDSDKISTVDTNSISSDPPDSKNTQDMTSNHPTDLSLLTNKNTLESFNNLDEIIKLYKLVGERNADFLFRWIYNIYDRIHLPSIDKKYKKILNLTKTKLGIFNVLIDDLADNSKTRNKELLEICMKIPWNYKKNYGNQYLEIARSIWEDCIKTIEKFPRYQEFEDFFYFDLYQFMNCNKYSYLVNSKKTSNFTEDRTYLHHGVMVLLHCDLDLMCSPDFNYNELGKLREILYLVQEFIHLGNMLSTYTREVEELDVSSPIISLALRRGIIERKILTTDPEFALESLIPLIPIYQKRMKENLSSINKYINDIESIDMQEFYQNLKSVGEAFLNRKQYWKTQNKLLEIHA